MTKDEVAALVRRYLEKGHLEAVRFTVNPESIQVGDGWYRVPLHPSCLPSSLTVLNEFVTDLEMDLHEIEGVNVLFSVMYAPEELGRAAVAKAA